MAASVSLSQGAASFPAPARTGVWTIRPDQALLWACVNPSPPMPAPVLEPRLSLRTAVALVGMVALAAVLGGVAAWALLS